MGDRAALHFIESTDNPQYQCPPYLGLKQEVRASVLEKGPRE